MDKVIGSYSAPIDRVSLETALTIDETEWMARVVFFGGEEVDVGRYNSMEEAQMVLDRAWENLKSFL
jgi:hypothetical protein